MVILSEESSSTISLVAASKSVSFHQVVNQPLTHVSKMASVTSVGLRNHRISKIPVAAHLFYFRKPWYCYGSSMQVFAKEVQYSVAITIYRCFTGRALTGPARGSARLRAR